MSPAQRAVADRSFERLYRRHRRDVYGFALRAVRDPDEAEDVTQTAFLNAYRALHRGDRPQKPRAWLLTIANNIARRQYRDRAARPQEVELDPELPSNGAEWNDLVAREIQGALRKLRPNRRIAVVLRDIEGLSYAEIAERMNLSEPAVETLLFRARNELQTELERLGREPSVRRRRSLRSLFVLPLPMSLVNYFDSLAFTLGRTPLTRAAGAVAAVVLGAGVVTQAGPLVQDAAADRPPAAARASVAPVDLADERVHRALTPSAAQAANGKQTKPGQGAASAAQAASHAGSDQGDAGSNSGASAAGSGSGAAGVIVELPPVAAPPLPLPDISGTLDQLPPPPPLPVPLG
ncbi:MAG: sigma-70 family RNA polymerase sigma factor [Gaiellales bacterium]